MFYLENSIRPPPQLMMFEIELLLILFDNQNYYVWFSVCKRSYFIRVNDFTRPAALLKEKLCGCYHINFRKYFRTPLKCCFCSLFISNKGFLKGTLLGLRQFVVTESPLKMMKNAFYFTSKAFSILKIIKFLYWLFGHVSKRLDWKDKVNFKFYDVSA